MKRTLVTALSLVLVLMAIVLAVPAAAETTSGEGVETAFLAKDIRVYGDLEYTVSDGEVTITGCSTEAISVTIPKEIGGYPVKRIGVGAFESCETLESVIIPDGVVIIDDFAFNLCRGLTEISIPDSVTKIGECAFGYCYDLESIVLPANLEEIGEFVFGDCTSLISVNLPEGLSAISENAFDSCESLVSMSIPNSVTSIGEDAFKGCVALSSVNIPDSVTSIGMDAFKDCKALTRVDISSLEKWCGINFVNRNANPLSYAKNLYLNGNLFAELVIPDGVTSIGDYAFSGCTSVVSVGFSEGFADIGKYAFNECTGLKDITLPSGMVSINEGVFHNCKSLVNVSIPDTVTSIGDYAFFGCGFANVDIPGNVKNIGERAFEGCLSLASIVVPDGVTDIGYKAFYDCNGAESLTLGKNVATIGESAFEGCTLITSLTVPENVTTVGKRAFNGLRNLTEINWNAKNTANFSTGNGVFSSAGQDGDGISVVFGDSVEKIPSCIFYPTTTYPVNSSNNIYPKIVSVIIGKNVTDIGYSAFSRCIYLTDITFGESVTSIGNSAFDECSALTDITLPDSLTSIGSGAFYDCTALEKITIPENVTVIDSSAFFNCKGLTQINWNAKNVADFDDDNRVFSSAGQDGDGIDVIFGDAVERIPSYALYPNPGMSGQEPKIVSVIIGENVKSIGTYALGNCTKIKSITIPESVSSIENYAFSGLRGLTQINWNAKNVADFSNNGVFEYAGQGEDGLVVVFGDSVKTIPANAFNTLTGAIPNIVSITVGDNTESIGEYAFYDCRELTCLDLGDGVTSIGAYAFYDCKLITSITIPENVTYIGDKAFAGCLLLTELNWNAKNVADFEDGNNIFQTAGRHGSGINLVFGNNVEHIPAYAFCPQKSASGYSLGNVHATIGKNVTSIGDCAFYGCRSIVIFCDDGSVAHEYALANDIECVTGSYIVIYNANGGENAPESQEKIHGTDLELSTDVPTREYYSFMGWATQSSGDVVYMAGDTYTADSTVTLYAVWAGDKYTISYDANGGEGAPENQTKVHGKNIRLSSVKPTREGYTFKGWAKSEDGNVSYGAGTEYRENAEVTFYAVWELNTYSVIFHTQYGTGTPKNQTKVHDIALVITDEAPTREGYTFKGWTTRENGTVVEYAAGDVYTANEVLMLYAVWQINTYTVSYDANGGEGAPEDHTKEHGDIAFISGTRPTREGYVFWGWATDANGMPEYDPGDRYTENKDITLYAVWFTKLYSVTYYVEDVEDFFDCQNKLHGDDLVLLDTKPVKAGDNFLGWATSPDATEPEYKTGDVYTLNESVDLYAVWGKLVASTKIKLETTKASMAVGGKTLCLEATLYPENSTDNIIWSVDKENIATVDENGVVTAVSVGKAKITAITESGKKATCTVTVGAPADTVEFTSLKSTSLALGKTLTLKAKAFRKDGTKPVSTNVVYEIAEGEEYAAIDAKGKLKGIAVGRVVVRATAVAGTEDDEAFDEIIVNVCIPATKVTLNTTKATMVVDEGLYLKATVLPANNTDTLTWTVDKPEIATVYEDGIVEAHKAGKVKVTATTGSGKKATCTITIGVPADTVEFSAIKSTSLAVGKTLTLKAKAFCEDGTKPVSTDVIYEIVDGEEYATIDSKGKLKGKAPGVVTVRATAVMGADKNGTYDEIEINVCIPAKKVTLNMTKATVSLDEGELQLEATMSPGNSTDTITWSVNKPTVATVDDNGLVTVHSAGKVKVTAKSGSGKSAYCTVTVTE